MNNPIICQLGDRGAKVRVIQRLLHVKVDGRFGMLTEEAVKDFQASHCLTANGIVSTKTWQKLLGYVLRPSTRRITEIIVHCTATRTGVNVSVEDIRRWHTAPVSQGGRGWSDIGYHYVIYRDGSVHEGRNVNIAGAHCYGHNTNSIGVCYVGGLARDGKTPADTRTKAQCDALEKLLIELRRIYPDAKIYGHRDFANKACPCFDVHKCYPEI